jgi:hypothetical protein
MNHFLAVAVFGKQIANRFCFSCSLFPKQLGLWELCEVLKKQTYVHQMECFMQDLVAWRAYYGLTAFPIVPKAAFYGNVTAMLMNAGKEDPYDGDACCTCCTRGVTFNTDPPIKTTLSSTISPPHYTSVLFF